MLGCTYIHKEAKSTPEFKAFKNRLTLLLGKNITKFKLKPFLIHPTENPHAHPKARMTQRESEHWFLN